MSEVFANQVLKTKVLACTNRGTVEMLQTLR